VKKRPLRLPEKELPGVIHGYTLADNAFLRLLGPFYQAAERALLRPWIERIRIDRPVFIVGPYRSGTTILGEIIASHPAVGFFWYLTNVFNRAPVLSYHTTRLFHKVGLLDRDPIAPVHNPAIPAQSLSPFECETVWLPTGRSLWDQTCPDMTLGAGFSDPAFERRLIRLIRGHLFASQTSRFLNKNPVNSLRVAYLHKLFPDARFINIVRDPLETVISHYRTAARVENTFDRDEHTRRIFRQRLYIDMLSRRIRTSGRPDTQTLDREHPLLGIAGQWVAMQQAVLNATAGDPDIRLLDLRYEDLVHQPERTLKRVWDFTELDDPPAAEVSALYVPRIAPRPPANLTPRERELLPRIREIVAPTAARLGYQSV
jgi:hypothetical protein